jgi:hypothetical protein
MSAAGYYKVKIGGIAPFYLRVTSETDTMLAGIEVDQSDDEIAPRGRDGKGRRFTERLRILEKSAVISCTPQVVDRTYALLMDR